MNLRSLRIGARLGIGFGIILTMLIAVLVVDNLISTKNREDMIAGLTRIDQEIEAPFKEAIRAVGAFNSEEAIKVIATRIDPLNQQSLVEINKLVEMERIAARRVLGGTIESCKQLTAILFVIGAVSLALGGLLAWALTRSIVRPLRDAVTVAERVAIGELTSKVSVRGRDEVSQLLQALKNMNDSLLKIVGDVRTGTDSIRIASGEMAAGNADLSSRTEMQSAALEKTVNSMEELTVTVKQNAHSAQQANQLVIAASDFAVQGGEVVGEVVNTMSSIRDSSRKIVDIISVIDGIAFQTNILALNAAVEAARAGEQGRGFAVVAAEVRNLAQRSAGAAREIKGLIGDSVEKVDLGSTLVEQAGMTMDEIVRSVMKVADIMREITAAGQAQRGGIEQVNRALGQMDQMTQQNAALVEEAAAAAQSMQDQSATLAGTVSVFKLEDVLRGQGTRTGSPARQSQGSGWQSVPAALATTRHPYPYVGPASRHRRLP